MNKADLDGGDEWVLLCCGRARGSGRRWWDGWLAGGRESRAADPEGFVNKM